ncbi:MAG: RNA methyltransferase [Lentisphaerae bacterium]|nr:RNA methyltransferase [Lentisphaerota bacterium]
MATPITSLQNERVKQVVKLRDRGARDETGLMLIEGYRETKRALDNGVRPAAFFFCRPLFLGTNEEALLSAAAAAGAEMFDCTEPVFRKMSYRDRPDGLLAVAPARRRGLDDLALPPDPLLLVMEHVEKPGNLGTMLRSADAGGVHAVIVCDRCTDVFNPNAVRASIGTIFTVPVVEATSEESLAWLRARGIRILAATPSAEKLHTGCDLARGVAIVVGSEQYGLTSLWMDGADERIRIPMLGQCDSLNVAAAATILVFEAVRQRLAAGKIRPKM